MKWLEIIDLRSASNRREELPTVLRSLAADLNHEPKRLKVRVYHSYLIDNDYSIHLIHQDSEPVTMGSPPGMRVVACLKEYGMVSHHLWCPMNGHLEEI